MKKGLTELVFILDRSGSMSGLEADTIGGYNGMMEKQKKEEGEAIISTVLFDDRVEVLHDRRKLDETIAPITDKDYYVRGCTALLDAVGGAIHHIGNVHKYAREEDVPEKTLFIITTDGYENASRFYTYEKVRQMIERQKEKYHWEFIFLGANMDAVNVAGRFGVAANRAVRFENDSVGTQLNYEVMSELVTKARCAKSAAAMNSAFEAVSPLQQIREDYEEYALFSGMRTESPDYAAMDQDGLKAFYPSMNRKEQQIMSYLYGLNGEGRHSYAQTGRQMGMSEGRVRQIENKVMRKMKR